MSITQRTDYETDAQAALTDQFRKEKIMALAATFSAQVQEIENVCFQILGGRTIDDAEGVQLDGLGALVGEPRQGREDDEYRLWIKVRVRLNLASGTGDEILDILAMLVDPAQTLVMTEYQPAAFIVDIIDSTDPDVADALNDILQSAKAGGVKAQLVTSEEAEADTFLFSDNTEITSATQGCADTDEDGAGGALALILE